MSCLCMCFTYCWGIHGNSTAMVLTKEEPINTLLCTKVNFFSLLPKLEEDIKSDIFVQKEAVKTTLKPRTISFEAGG